MTATFHMNGIMLLTANMNKFVISRSPFFQKHHDSKQKACAFLCNLNLTSPRYLVLAHFFTFSALVTAVVCTLLFHFQAASQHIPFLSDLCMDKEVGNSETTGHPLRLNLGWFLELNSSLGLKDKFDKEKKKLSHAN